MDRAGPSRHEIISIVSASEARFSRGVGSTTRIRWSPGFPINGSKEERLEIELHQDIIILVLAKKPHRLTSDALCDIENQRRGLEALIGSSTLLDALMTAFLNTMASRRRYCRYSRFQRLQVEAVPAIFGAFTTSDAQFLYHVLNRASSCRRITKEAIGLRGLIGLNFLEPAMPRTKCDAVL
jgi:hypothetical protein